MRTKVSKRSLGLTQPVVSQRSLPGDYILARREGDTVYLVERSSERSIVRIPEGSPVLRVGVLPEVLSVEVIQSSDQENFGLNIYVDMDTEPG